MKIDYLAANSWVSDRTAYLPTVPRGTWVPMPRRVEPVVVAPAAKVVAPPSKAMQAVGELVYILFIAVVASCTGFMGLLLLCLCQPPTVVVVQAPSAV